MKHDKEKWINRLKRIFTSADAVFAARYSILTSRKRKLISLSRFPLLTSRFFRKVNTVNNQTYPHYTNNNTHWQGEFPEEITGKSHDEDIFPQVPKDFSDTLPGFVAQSDKHKRFLFLSGGVNREDVSRTAWGSSFVIMINNVTIIFDNISKYDLHVNQFIFQKRGF